MALEELLKDKKASAYDILAQMEYLKNVLQQTNAEIAKLTKEINECQANIKSDGTKPE